LVENIHESGAEIIGGREAFDRSSKTRDKGIYSWCK